ncbi:MAG: hypothetical protein DWQ30_22800 [Acidobacteria bacterium]|nr:MAG: hypothetical protein DWQ30_22800 [Acidobacteriota bacterium]
MSGWWSRLLGRGRGRGADGADPVNGIGGGRGPSDAVEAEPQPDRSGELDESARLDEVDGIDEIDAVVLPDEDSLDLHPFRPRDVADVVRAFVDDAWDRGRRELRIVHGRGIGTQRGIVRAVLSRDPRVAALSDAPGNWGATIVHLGEATEGRET